MSILRRAVLFSAFFSLFLGSAIASPAASTARHAMKPTPRVTVVPGRVIAGNPRSFSAVGKVDRKAVFLAIPAIQRIKREKISRNSARYRFLMVEANKVFDAAMARLARERGVDLIVEAGGVSAVGIGVVDLTAELKKAVAAKKTDSSSKKS